MCYFSFATTMPRESDLDKTTRIATKLFHKVKQTAASRHEFVHFGVLNNVETLEFELEDFADIQRAIFTYAREKNFDPIPFFIKHMRTGAILFRAEIQYGRGFVVQDMKLSERKLMIFTLPNNSAGYRNTRSVYV